jgi:hypothetical protein
MFSMPDGRTQPFFSKPALPFDLTLLASLGRKSRHWNNGPSREAPDRGRLRAIRKLASFKPTPLCFRLPCEWAMLELTTEAHW